MIVGPGQMLLGNCLDVMAKIPDGSVDMVLCDLPYGTTACSWDSIIPFEPLWAHYWRVAKPNAAIVLTASQPFTSALVMSQIKNFKVEWVWEKNRGSNFAATKFVPMKEHESVLVFAKGRCAYSPIFEPRAEGGKSRAAYTINPSNTGKRAAYNGMAAKSATNIDPNMRVPRSIQKFNTEVGFHPTQKPVDLFEYFIRTYTQPGETVLDNCSGSGTTAIAAINSDRRFVCIEQDVEYYYKSLTRVRDRLAVGAPA